jgi:hypothetical protein
MRNKNPKSCLFLKLLFCLLGLIFYCKALPAHYAFANPPSTVGLVGYWSYDEGTGIQCL